MGRPLLPQLERIRDKQLERNSDLLNELDGLLEKVTPFVQQSQNYFTQLRELYILLEKAHGMIIQGKYADYYTHDLRPASSSIFSFYGGLNEDFQYLEETKREELTRFLPDLSQYSHELKITTNAVKELIEDLATENSFISRFEGMEEISKKMKELLIYWDYPAKLVVGKVWEGREFIAPPEVLGLPKVYPFHVRIYIQWAPIFNSTVLLKEKIHTARRLLKETNANLPFAELKDQVPQIQNIVNGIDRSTSIGSGVNIGDSNAIGDNALVETEGDGS